MSATDLHLETLLELEGTGNNLHLETEAALHSPLVSFTLSGTIYNGLGTQNIHQFAELFLYKDNLDGTSTFIDYVLSVDGTYIFPDIVDNDPQYYIVGFRFVVGPNKYDITDHNLVPGTSVAPATDLHFLTITETEAVNPEDIHLVTETFKHTEQVVLEDGQGASPVISKETLTIVKFEIEHCDPGNTLFRITHHLVTPFKLLIKVDKVDPLAQFNLLVHHFDIRTKQFISTIRTAIADFDLKLKND